MLEVSIHYPIVSMSGWGVGDIITVSGLAVQVHTACKDAPDDYRDISEEVAALRSLIGKAAQHLRSTTINSDDCHHGQKALKDCQSVLQDLYSHIEKFKRLSAYRKSLVFKGDIATLRERLISSAVLLNGFVRRFAVPAIPLQPFNRN